MKRLDNDKVVDEPPAKRARIQSQRYEELMASLGTNNTTDTNGNTADREEEEEEDPFEAFMRQNDAITAKQKKLSQKKEEELAKNADYDEKGNTISKQKVNGKANGKKNKKKNNLELDDEDPMDAYMKQLESNPHSFLPSRFVCIYSYFYFCFIFVLFCFIFIL